MARRREETEAYKAVLLAVKQYYFVYRLPPTVAEVMGITGISSTSVVIHWFDRGVEDGEFIRTNGGSRSVMPAWASKLFNPWELDPAGNPHLKGG